MIGSCKSCKRGRNSRKHLRVYLVFIKDSGLWCKLCVIFISRVSKIKRDTKSKSVLHLCLVHIRYVDLD
jgi:hypothetical protein